MKKFGSSLCGKFFKTTIVIIVLCAASIFFAMNILYSINLGERIQAGVKNEINYIDLNLSDQQERYESMIYSDSGIKRLYNIVNKKDEYISEFMYYSDLEQVFMDNYFTHKGLMGLAYFDEDGDMLSLGRVTNDEAVKCYEDYKRLTIDTRQPLWLSFCIGSDCYYTCFMELEFLDDRYRTAALGMAILFVDSSMLCDSISIPTDDACDFVISDPCGNIAISSDEQYLVHSVDESFKETSSGMKSLLTGKHYISAQIGSYSGRYHITGLYDTGNMYRQIRLFALISLLITVAACGIAAVVLYCFAKRISDPIVRMSEYMRTVDVTDPNKAEWIETKQYYNEIDLMYKSFNELLDRFREQLVENYKLDVKFKDAYIEALERQINPHFIFNTLQMIQMAVVIDDKYKVFDLIGCFGEIIRFNLDRENIVRIEDETQNIENYFRILKMRFGDKIEYFISIPPEIMKCSTVKFLFQPIIENAVMHGIEQKDGAGFIVIAAKVIKNEIVFIIRDNGAGMDPKSLNDLKSSLCGKGQGSSIGLFNVNERIKTLYGNDYGLEIYSVENKGTTVMIHFPVQREEIEEL